MPILNMNGNRFVRIVLIVFASWMALMPASLSASGKESAELPDPPVSKTKQKANEMLARTKPGYYTALFVTNRKGSKMSNARTRAVEACGTTCSSSPLPVTLISFSGKRLDARQIQLDWTTTSEVNNDYFEIERTLNPATGFQAVGSVKGQGNSAADVSYQFTDPNAETIYTYYRLKQVDLDGSFVYSRIIAIKGYHQELTVHAFPNPGSGKELAFIVAGETDKESISVRIYDQKGRLVYQNTKYILPENQQISLPGIATQPGSYHIKIRTKQQEASSSFVIIR
ncbi:T9SS type A sorting domain-containing protein [Dyadobacter sp. CY345]|uniref:T9SS type A sorting domain-containing protein n=1 Tax=Dyadobacter sp. CY345 TaxID=2909335 RepID=UPI001F3A52C3|nr:T9SS type A sorting domain-containing protein [Dyadobacter sp. CY345]MCF2446314.1 T9SS type A sorting domain-containing protein [Dyadobacter sp. CY345]